MYNHLASSWICNNHPNSFMFHLKRIKLYAVKLVNSHMLTKFCTRSSLENDLKSRINCNVSLKVSSSCERVDLRPFSYIRSFSLLNRIMVILIKSSGSIFQFLSLLETSRYLFAFYFWRKYYVTLCLKSAEAFLSIFYDSASLIFLNSL